MNDSVLVDTSVWISFFRQSDRSLSEKLKPLLRNGKPAYTGLVATELIRGAKSNKELAALEQLFKSIEYLETKEDYFKNAGSLGMLLSGKGITIGTVDLLIAQIAISNNALLFTLDTHFAAIARHSELQLY